MLGPFAWQIRHRMKAGAEMVEAVGSWPPAPSFGLPGASRCGAGLAVVRPGGSGASRGLLQPDRDAVQVFPAARHAWLEVAGCVGGRYGVSPPLAGLPSAGHPRVGRLRTCPPPCEGETPNPLAQRQSERGVESFTARPLQPTVHISPRPNPIAGQYRRSGPLGSPSAPVSSPRPRDEPSRAFCALPRRPIRRPSAVAPWPSRG